MSRQSRKLDHIKFALEATPSQPKNGFDDLHLIYQTLPGLCFDEIDPSIRFLGKRLTAPILINAMTGGHPDIKWINRALALAAARTGIAMAVGSQRAGLENPSVRDTYQVVRDVNPDGVILANLGANATPDQTAQAVSMLGADGIQLHLNVAHELAMAEGDRDFRGILANINHVIRHSAVPVIAKEVGNGLSRESAALLATTGVRYLDVGGWGGTNFVQIEHYRTNLPSQGLNNFFGLTTAVSLLEVLSLNEPITVIASGGITDSRQIAVALALGARLAGIAGPFLRVLVKESEEALVGYIEQMINYLKIVMLMAGARHVEDLAHKPVIITGPTAEWLERRHINIDRYARRSTAGVDDQPPN